MKSRRRKVSNPCIGVFWADISVDGRKVKIFTERIRVEDGEDYNLGKFTIFNLAHYDVWQKIQKMNSAWKSRNFEDIPRGRTAFRKADSKFIVIFGSDCDTAIIRQEITRAFNLPYNQCVFIKDFHYELPDSDLSLQDISYPNP